MRIVTGTVATLIVCLVLPIGGVAQTPPQTPATPLPRFGVISAANRGEASDPLTDRLNLAIRDQVASTLHVTAVDLAGGLLPAGVTRIACATNNLVGYIEPHAASIHGYDTISATAALVITDCRGFIVYAATGRYAEDPDVSTEGAGQVDEVQARSREALQSDLHAFIAGHEAGWNRLITGGNFVSREDAQATGLHELIQCSEFFNHANFVAARGSCQSGLRLWRTQIEQMNTLLFIKDQTPADHAAILLMGRVIMSAYEQLALADAKIGKTVEGRLMGFHAAEWVVVMTAYLAQRFPDKQAPEFGGMIQIIAPLRAALERSYPGILQSATDNFAYGSE